MRAAPAVRAPLHASGLERMLISGLYATSGAALAAWALAQTALAQPALAQPALAPQGVAWAILLLAAAAAGALGVWQARFALPADGAYLGWDGVGWALGLHPAAGGNTVPAETPLAAVVVAIDLGAWLLLCLHPATGPCRWQAANARAAGADWHGLRLALQAHAGRRTPATAGPP